MLKDLKPDERIEKESNGFYGKMYYVISLLMILSVIVKVVCKVPWFVYGLELLALAVSGVFLLVQELRKGILFVRKKDEVLSEIHSKNLRDAFMVDFWILIFGDLLFLNIDEYFFWLYSYLIIVMIPALIITVATLKNGWMVWGGKKREQMGKKRLAFATTLGAAFFGITTGGEYLYYDGAFHASGILWILGMGVGFGLLFYFLMSGFIKISEEQADYKTKMAEKKSLEQEGATHEE
ncbi:MAG: hypothetical protein E7268_07935 [Lachnospiraceae bacterium]|nr:hypothetical protein [Lachnospiraceae bacterium]